MDDVEKGPLPTGTESMRAAKGTKDSPVHDTAAAKLWAVYVSEAEKYDRGLVESWKSDMEGMLIFAGLFSASLTAFLIESYKTLNPDSGDTTAQLLAQISQQLAASANGTPFQIPPTTPFQPSASSLVGNILWFISLGLSLICALIATLLEQWARDFLHRADMRSAPVVRARIFSFLYYGLKRFKMHTVVEIIPLLLHASLLLFFVGLVAFLLPVNIVLTAVVAFILVMITVVYALLTLLPLIYLDCPYRTPLSRGFWSIHHHVKAMLNRWRPRLVPVSQPNDEAMVDAVFRQAIELSPQRSIRDMQALIWTVNSLADDDELEPFLEAIPDVLWLPESESSGQPVLHGQRRYIYDDHMHQLMSSPDVQILRRLKVFYINSFSGLLSKQVRERRQICVYKAVWALGCLSLPGQPAVTVLGSRGSSHFQVAPEAAQYNTSALAVEQWANMRAAQPLLEETLRQLTAFKLQMKPENTEIPHSSLLGGCLSKLAEYSIYPGHFTPFSNYKFHSAEALLAELEDCIADIHALPCAILVRYLRNAARSGGIPYRFWLTRSLIVPQKKCPFLRVLREIVTDTLWMMMDLHKDRFKADDQFQHWLDEVFRMILSYWEPEDSDALPSAVLDYINCRKSDYAMFLLASELSENAWKAALRLFSAEPRTMTRFGNYEPVVNLTSCLTTVWRLCQAHPDRTFVVNPSVFDELVDLVSKTSVPWLTPSVVAMAKCCFFRSLPTAFKSDQRDMISAYHNHHFPPETSTSTRSTEELKGNDLEQLRRSIYTRCAEAALDTLSRFIECCVSDDLPYKPVETVVRLCPAIHSAIHPVHQVRFSNVARELLDAAVGSAEREALSQQILNLSVFAGYRPNHDVDVSPGRFRGSISTFAWLDDFDARHTLKAALTAYLPKLSSTNQDEILCSRVQEIITNLDALHPQQDSVVTEEVPSADHLQLNEEQVSGA
ncbi:hypothetical protein C8R47DRAFT_1074284 [Mycena vitilis]|nr:hypothetical protein C8R47DRAFT_1074284 [Mycena vitilis]